MNRPLIAMVVEVVEYDERWPHFFKELRDTVGPTLVGIRNCEITQLRVKITNFR